MQVLLFAWDSGTPSPLPPMTWLLSLLKAFLLVHACSLCSGCFCAWLPFMLSPCPPAGKHFFHFRGFIQAWLFSANFFYLCPCCLTPIRSSTSFFVPQHTAYIATHFIIMAHFTTLQHCIVHCRGLRPCLIQNYLCLALWTFFTSKNTLEIIMIIFMWLKKLLVWKINILTHLITHAKLKHTSWEVLYARPAVNVCWKNKSISLFIGFKRYLELDK